jgi:hypothetical protein
MNFLRDLISVVIILAGVIRNHGVLPYHGPNVSENRAGKGVK